MKDLVINKIAKNHHIIYNKVNYNKETELFSLLQNNESDLTKLDTIKNNKRRLEWMTIRGLLIQYFKMPIDIVYDSQNKPHLNKTNFQVSISHSKEMVAISLQENHDNGIDIQHIDQKIERIRNKYLKPQESKAIEENDYETLTIYWSIKEALFKVYGTNDIFLKENIEVIDFNRTKMSAIGAIKNCDYYKKLSLRISLVDDYVLAYTVNH